MRYRYFNLFAMAVLGSGVVVASPAIDVARHTPFNLFDVQEPVQLSATLKDFTAGNATASVHIKDYFGHEAYSATPQVQVANGKPASLDIEPGKLPCGYYQLSIDAMVDGKPVATTASFGVVKTVHRTAAEARDGNFRFGLKVFETGDIWWRKGTRWELAEAVDASALLGLQWTRHAFNEKPSEEPGMIATIDLITKHPMNVVLKVEGIPDEAYDEARYGPKEEYLKKNKKGWRRTTVPKKEPYQAWLRKEIEKIPPEQNVFEIGNEVWNYMSAPEFAEWTQQAVEVIKQVRPNAIIGADPGKISWGRQFIAGGGFNGCAMQVIHPYTFTPMPEVRIRAWLRNRRDFVKEMTGRDLDIYVTEYGFSTAPDDKRKQAVSERSQAQRTVRESLMLYAEDCKTLIPHWMADREQDPTDREHWFGFFRLNGQPKPVVIAHATSARMIDASRFVGDLDYGPGVGAMLFERGGLYTLCLWTLDEAIGTGREVSIESVAKGVTCVNVMGDEKPLIADGGKLVVRISGDMTYLVGVDPSLEKQATPAKQDLNSETWTARAGSMKLAHATTSPAIDGSLADWAGATPVEFSSREKSTINPGKVYLAWDREAAYVAVEVLRAPQPGDALEVRLSTRPARQIFKYENWSIYDYTLQLTPPSDKEPASLKLTNAMWEKPVANPLPGDRSGVRWSVKATKSGWIAEAAIPRALLRDMPDKAGEKMSGFIELTTSGPKNEVRFKNAQLDADETLRWPYLVLQP